jgi:hypothetical protein
MLLPLLLLILNPLLVSLEGGDELLDRHGRVDRLELGGCGSYEFESLG